MTVVLERIFELLKEWFRYLVPFIVVQDDQVGIVLRVGRFHRELETGFNWKWPVIETALLECSALDTAVLREQSFTTLDGVPITLRGLLTYRVVDPRKYILDCANAVSVVSDLGCGVIAEIVPKRNASDVLQASDEFKALMLRKVRNRARRWGIDVENFCLIDSVQARTYRLITTGSAHADGVPNA